MTKTLPPKQEVKKEEKPIPYMVVKKILRFFGISLHGSKTWWKVLPYLAVAYYDWWIYTTNQTQWILGLLVTIIAILLLRRA